MKLKVRSGNVMEGEEARLCDIMQAYDSLPRELRETLANSIVPYNPFEAIQLYFRFGTQKACELLRTANVRDHIDFVEKGLTVQVGKLVLRPHKLSHTTRFARRQWNGISRKDRGHATFPPEDAGRRERIPPRTLP